MFGMPGVQGSGAGNTGTPPTVYASNANPALTDASKPPTPASLGTGNPAIPAAPAAPTPLGAGLGAKLPANPYEAMLTQLGLNV